MRITTIILCLCMVVFVCHGERIHTVKKNETLSAIAGKYGVSTSSLQAYNGITNPNLVFIGKKLKIPDSTVQQIEYTVKKGDSLGGVASRFGIKLSDLTSRNNIDRPDLIKVGQKIIIPIKGGAIKKSSLLPASLIKSLTSIRPTARKWKKIIIHHSATPTDDALNMHRVHKARGMKNGLAYHFVISNGSRKAYDGEVYIGSRWKGQLDGGHVKKQSLNKTCIGICLIGNFETRSPTAKQLSALEGLCEYLMKRCQIPKSQVTTHKIIHPGHTACPGKLFSLPSLIRRLDP